MALALFDLDNTLLNGDSDHAWGLFLAENSVLDPVQEQTKQDYFYQQYLTGKLDIFEFLEHQLRPLAEHPIERLHEWRAEFMQQVIAGMIDTGKSYLLEPHQRAGDEIVIITATNDFVTRPIADQLGVANLIATTAEIIDGNYTGRCAGTPCFQEGKIRRLESWLADTNCSFDSSIFYSDSINDLPLLEQVDTPVAVTPDEQLRAHAKQHNWKIID